MRSNLNLIIFLVVQYEIVDQKALSEMADPGKQKLHHKQFMGSFSFSDDGYQLLEALAAGTYS